MNASSRFQNIAHWLRTRAASFSTQGQALGKSLRSGASRHGSAFKGWLGRLKLPKIRLPRIPRLRGGLGILTTFVLTTFVVASVMQSKLDNAQQQASTASKEAVAAAVKNNEAEWQSKFATQRKSFEQQLSNGERDAARRVEEARNSERQEASQKIAAAEQKAASAARTPSYSSTPSSTSRFSARLYEGAGKALEQAAKTEPSYREEQCRACNATGKITCTDCEGSGKILCTTCKNGTVECKKCDSYGKVTSGIIFTETKICPDCAGTKIAYCPDCKGTRLVKCSSMWGLGGCGGTGERDCPKCIGGKIKLAQ